MRFTPATTLSRSPYPPNSYVRLSPADINVLKGEINKRATIATIVATAAVMDAQLNTLLLNLTSLPGIRCVSVSVVSIITYGSRRGCLSPGRTPACGKPGTLPHTHRRFPSISTPATAGMPKRTHRPGPPNDCP